MSTFQSKPSGREQLANEETIAQTMQAVRSRGVKVELVSSKDKALQRLTEMIPSGAEITTGSSTTLQEIGFADLLKSGNHHWKNLRDQVFAEKDPAKQMELRKRSLASEYFLGSVHAVAKTGETIVASASGSQISAYAFLSSNLIWVAGTQK